MSDKNGIKINKINKKEGYLLNNFPMKISKNLLVNYTRKIFIS